MPVPRQSRRDDTPLAGARVLVVEARFYGDIADGLLAGARAVLAAAEVDAAVLSVPGALEISPMLAIALDAAAAQGAPYEAAVALGCVIRGETGHYDIVAGESARALMDLAVARALPLGNGIITVDNAKQARARSRTGAMNKGAGAAQAALAVLRLKRRLAAAPEQLAETPELEEQRADLPASDNGAEPDAEPAAAEPEPSVAPDEPPAGPARRRRREPPPKGRDRRRERRERGRSGDR